MLSQIFSISKEVQSLHCSFTCTKVGAISKKLTVHPSI